MRTLLVMLLAASSIAEAETLEARWMSHENIHMADDRGAISHSRSISISLELRAGGKVRVDEEGLRKNHHLDANGGTTEEKAVWTNAWSGTWKKTGAKLALTLALDSHACKATQTIDRTHVSPEKCREVSKQVTFQCTTETIKVEQGAKQVPTAAWMCHAGEGAALGESVGTWVFGKQRCIVTGDGRHGMHYRFCP